jgi:O-methyltransferase
MTATLDQIAGAALSSIETVRASYDIARLAIERGVPGDFVECGVFAGAQCAAMALAIMDQEPPADLSRRIHLFDSFTGIPAHGPEDGAWPHPPGTSRCDLATVQRLMREWGIDESLLVYHEGPFSETIPSWILGETTEHVGDGTIRTHYVQRQIAVLRLDADLYESTKVVLQYLYPLVSPGGWLIVDDFALPGARKAVLESGMANCPAYFQRQPPEKP